MKINDREKTTIVLLLCLGAVCLMPSGCDLYPQYDFVPLEFPFAAPADIDYLAAFGIPDWSGPGHPHDGIDLRTIQPTTIIAPIHGTISNITWNTTGALSTPPDLVMVHVTIYVNDEWHVKLVFEPSGVQADILQAQLNALQVSQGQAVEAGDVIGDLLVGTEGYPHLHYMPFHNDVPQCAYAHSSDAARLIFDQIAALPGNNMPAGTICGD